ncbi:MAG TPA: SDR family oxidoreductase [Candidatus Competibacteraceae bacterium]|nr:SDR family oxidoreductase [Candidatus Competibacteraceae bacterium]HRZ04741.1 SDR family oxidoreductase [Candidatus Competibacteraceae bacterium]HSA46487.1 SDR family oxidoreductase [Candidatus Competibacteraceae bacterium]
MARILIAGCGDVGTTLGQALGAAGHKVWGLKRHPADLPSSIQPLAADLTDPATLTVLPPKVDAVVYSAAAAGFSEAHYQAAYVEGVHNLLNALRQAGQHPQRLLFTSSTSVYAQHQGEWVDEDSPAKADGFSGRCLREGERLMWNSGWPAVAVRFGGIYGPGRTRLIDNVRVGSATCSDGPPIYTNRIHRDDCARVLEHLLKHPKPEPLYIAVDDDPASLDEVLNWLADQLGVPQPPRVPQPPLKPGAETRRDPATRMRASKRCRNVRLRASGFQFRYPSYREGYAALIPKS